MTHFFCATCGTQFSASESVPAHCPICEDDRQYIGPNGQQWLSYEQLANARHNLIQEHEPGLIGIGTEPRFAIAQRALLVQSPAGNILWDCISLIDQPTIDAVQALGGIRAIAISHPHYYSAMIEWSYAFGKIPIYLHAADQQWVMRPDPVIEFWEGEQKELWDGLRLIRSGGHFAGGTVAYWPAGAGGNGALLTGDIINVVQDRRYVSFMRSYPNQIPLHAGAVRRIVESVEPFAFERIYGAWWDTIVAEDAKRAVQRSAERYMKAINGEYGVD